MSREHDQAASAFDAAAFIERIEAAGERPVIVTGVSERTISRHLESLRSAAGEGRDVVLVRAGAGNGHALERAVTGYLQRVDDAVGLGPTTIRLAEAAEQASGSKSPSLKIDAIARLWTRLVARRPAFLLVLNPDEADDGDLDVIRHFARFVYSDPLAELAPEAESWERPAGRLLFVGEPPFELEAETVDFADDTITAIRDYLSRDDVVRRFLATTDGDVSRLGEFVERLPDNANHLALYRYDGLPPQEQAILRVLAAAGRPLAPEQLLDAVALLGVSEFFSRSMRSLENAGMLTKSMGHGRIVVGLEDGALGRALLNHIDPEQRQAAHRALADAELANNSDNPDPELLARHCGSAGDWERALEYGSQAIGRLLRRREFADARRLTEGLIEHADDERRGALRLQLAEILEQLGDYRAALDVCIALGADHPDDDGALALRKGRLLARVGEFDEALDAFDAALEDPSDAVRRDALLARSDAAYAIGEHHDAVERLTALIDDLNDGDVEPSVRDAAILSARNTLGKIAIVRNEFSDAVDYFEDNRELASNWGWEDEISRAQANLGVVALQRDDHGEALDRLQGALEASGARGSLPRAYCLMNLASVYQRKNEFDRALDHCLEAMRCARKVGDDTAYAVSARNLATIYQDVGAYERANSIVEHLREEYEGDDTTLAGGWNLLVQAQLHHDCGELEEAQALYERLNSARLAPVFGTEATLRLAQIHAELGHRLRAEELLTEVELGERPLYHGLVALLRADAKTEEEPNLAAELSRTAYEILEEVGEKNEPVRARLVLAEALEELGRDEEARTALQRELARVREVAEHVPEQFVDSYWRKPLHRELVETLQKLEGEVPVECVPSASDEAAAPTTDSKSAEFRQWRSRYSEIVGEDPRLHQIFRLIDKVADSDATVLVYGESGTGKELVATALHRRSMRTGKPFVKVNCAAFVENLLLSELFGHEKGAFTGAVEQKTGRFEMADGGTIFLDEIGDISPNTQVALLRVLQEGTFERVGGSKTLTTDVRVVCATNKNLEEMVQRGEFRLDLYYRLKGVVLEMPPLRERREDIARLANHFAATCSDTPKVFSPDALQFLASYSWPGNVRELQNFVTSILLFVDGSVVELQDIEEFSDFFVSGEIDPSLPKIDVESLSEESEVAAEGDEEVEADDAFYAYADPADALVEKIVAEGRSLTDIKKRLEMECIKRALIETGGNVTQAAEILQMKRPRLSQIINGDEDLVALKARLTG